ncbi:MAG: hypothetical protein ACYCO3_05970 [Mycobacteriales bacterium]
MSPLGQVTETVELELEDVLDGVSDGDTLGVTLVLLLGLLDAEGDGAEWTAAEAVARPALACELPAATALATASPPPAVAAVAAATTAAVFAWVASRVAKVEGFIEGTSQVDVARVASSLG